MTIREFLGRSPAWNPQEGCGWNVALQMEHLPLAATETKPSLDATCIAFEVEDLDGEISRLKSKSVEFVLDTTETPVCRFAMIADPDGNRILIHKRKS